MGCSGGDLTTYVTAPPGKGDLGFPLKALSFDLILKEDSITDSIISPSSPSELGTLGFPPLFCVYPIASMDPLGQGMSRKDLSCEVSPLAAPVGWMLMQVDSGSIAPGIVYSSRGDFSPFCPSVWEVSAAAFFFFF